MYFSINKTNIKSTPPSFIMMEPSIQLQLSLSVSFKIIRNFEEL